MNYNILLISTSGIQIKEDFVALLKKSRENISVIINRQEKVNMLDISELLNYFYKEFDSIFIITREKMQEGVFKTEYNNFQKIVIEANRILSKRGLTDERIKIFNWDGKSYEKLNDFIMNSFKNLTKIGQNPVKFEKLKV